MDTSNTDADEFRKEIIEAFAARQREIARQEFDEDVSDLSRLFSFFSSAHELISFGTNIVQQRRQTQQQQKQQKNEDAGRQVEKEKLSRDMLQLKPDEKLTEEKINRAYNKQLRAFHPDKVRHKFPADSDIVHKSGQIINSLQTAKKLLLSKIPTG